MKRKTFHTCLGTMILGMGLLISQAAPVSAAPSAITAVPLGCVLDGVSYPMGTRKPAGPEFYRVCELTWQTDSQGFPHLVPVWKIYPK